MADPLWDVTECARQLCLARPTIYAWVHRKRIPFLKLGNRVLFQPREIESWLTKFRKTDEEK